MKKEIIFMDGEFTGLYPDGIEFVSLALVKENGDELYMEIEYKGDVVDWVKVNIIPNLNGKIITKEEAKEKILEFVGNEKPYLMSYVNQFDWMGICGLFGVWEVPFYWVPLDFATMLFQKGIIPELTTPEDLAQEYGISLENYKKHTALDDARLIRELYQKIFANK